MYVEYFIHQWCIDKVLKNKQNNDSNGKSKSESQKFDTIDNLVDTKQISHKFRIIFKTLNLE